MSINKVQFQKGLSMDGFLEKFGLEKQCLEYIENAKFKNGYKCHKCGSLNYYIVWHGTKKTFQCKNCGTQTTLTSGTIFQNTKLPIKIWFQAMFFITQSKNNISALELKRLLGICYRSAWRLKHKIIQSMLERENKRILEGIVQLDDAYLGGRNSGGKAGRGSENKIPFLAAVETDNSGNPRHAIYSIVDSFNKNSLKKWSEKKLAKNTTVITDGLFCFNALAETGVKHTKTVVGTNRKSSDLKCFKWVNIILSNLKTAISGTYHSIKIGKYASRYLAEFQYRFNRRFNMDNMVDRLAYALIQTKPRPENWLRM